MHGVCLTKDREESKEDGWLDRPAAARFLRYLRYLLFKQLDLLVFLQKFAKEAKKTDDWPNPRLLAFLRYLRFSPSRVAVATFCSNSLTIDTRAARSALPLSLSSFLAWSSPDVPTYVGIGMATFCSTSSSSFQNTWPDSDMSA